MSITRDELLRWFDYDPSTGIFRWREKPERSYVKIGEIAGSAQDKKGRRVLWLQRRRINCARAAYIYVHGDIPDGMLIDHADGDRSNDRIANLRPASAVQNTWNRLRRDGSELKLGAARTSQGRFNARIQPTGGSKIYLGTWDTEAEAHAAYMGAAAILHSEFWIGNRPGHHHPGWQEDAANV
jgi:hypothetical protein